MYFRRMDFHNFSTFSINRTIHLNTSNWTFNPPNLPITGPTWSFMTIFNVLIVICALITNITVLLMFLCKQELLTSFNIYLINLLSANIISVLLQNIPDIFNRLYSSWWLGNGYCTVFIVGLYIFEAGVQNCHVLIAVNRVWAVFWPYSYRTRHRRAVAVLLCLLGWVYVLAVLLPGFVMDVLYYRTNPNVTGCYLNIGAQWVWSVVVQFLVYDMGLFLMWLAYPIIWLRRRSAQKISPTTIPTVQSVTGKVMANVEKMETLRDEDEEERTLPKEKKNERIKRSSNAFTILTILTISVTVCWTPCRTIYTALMFVPLDWINPLLLNIALVLFSLQSFFDPILFVWALPGLRQSFRLHS